MPKSTLAGHPAHPILVAFPIGLLSFSFAMDLMYLATRKRVYAETSYYSMIAGFCGGLVAAGTGAADYLSIPNDSPANRTANVHALLNAVLMTATGANLFRRRGKRIPSGKLETVLSGVGTLGLLVSGWFGGSLIYKYGLRVRSVDPIAHAPEVRLPGDQKLEHALQRFERPEAA
ncbi:MAG TPA: DUF2231 domain-containing protein [Terriglobales bacterium]|nr:DUF2231 domain-containing protein [Terriglobales bacterium]